MNVLVLGGGRSPERDVSLRSAKAVYEAAKQAGLDVSYEDSAKGLNLIIGDVEPDTIVFPILHGEGGEDGILQAQLQSNGIPLLGSDSQSSAACFDKWRTRLLFSKAELPVARGELVNMHSYNDTALRSEPHVLKVLHGGSSIGTLIVRDPDKTDDGLVSSLFAMEDTAVIEELIEGIEITVPILDRDALPIIEIVPPKGLEFDYENKYNGATAEICPAKSVSEEIQAKARKLAEKAHQAMGCRHLSRVDMIVKPNGDIVLLEINTIPGLTGQSLYPKAAAVAGLTMPELVKKFVQMVARDYNL